MSLLRCTICTWGMCPIRELGSCSWCSNVVMAGGSVVRFLAGQVIFLFS